MTKTRTNTRKTTARRNRVAVQRAVRGAPSAASLRKFALAAGPAPSLTLRVVGAAESRRLNRTFRRKPHPTNVLSFSYGGGHGDIVLCHPVIRKEAREQGKPLRAHYAHLVVHGVLHLRGHDHVTKRGAARMERREIRILRRLGVGDPYAVR
jgi:probable rRNA maturation factor